MGGQRAGLLGKDERGLGMFFFLFILGFSTLLSTFVRNPSVSKRAG